MASTRWLSDVRYWHKADILVMLSDVRFWGQSGHQPARDFIACADESARTSNQALHTGRDGHSLNQNRPRDLG
jgi:hypothetical protein